MKFPRHIALILAMLALVAAPPAIADYNDVIRDCNEDGDLDREYSDRELREAEEKLPSDIDEYTDCRAVIRSARSGRRSRGGSAGGVPGFRSLPGGYASAEDNATPEDRAALNEAKRDRSDRAREDAAVTIDGESVVPGGDDEFTAARTAANELPLSVLLVLICVATLAAAIALAAATRRWPRIARGPLRLLRR
jgi:hypothetical protein